jgi:hypothetical protein
MQGRKLVVLMLFAGAMAACSGGEGGNAAGNEAAAANGSASFDPNSEQGRAYTAVVECAGTHEAAASIIGGVSMSKSGAERQQYLDEENRRKGQARTLSARAVELGAALGLTASAVEEQVTAHAGTFVQTASSGTMDQFGATVAAQANSCAANYPDLIR